MMQKELDIYDDPSGLGGVGDGCLTQKATWLVGTAGMLHLYQYDFRDRMTADYFRDGPLLTLYTLDNLGQLTFTQFYANANGFTPTASNLRKQWDYFYDERQRLYLTDLFEVSPSTSTSPPPGTVGNKLPTNFWYNRRGLKIKTKNAN